MIAKEFELFLEGHLTHYLIPAEKLAIVIDTHHANHVLLLLTHNGYSRVPVISKEKGYQGTISIADILSYKEKNGVTDWEMTQMPITDMINHKITPILETATLTQILHLLVDYPFLPVVDETEHFVGIITRKSILKAVNSLLHDFTTDYRIISKHDD